MRDHPTEYNTIKQDKRFTLHQQTKSTFETNSTINQFSPQRLPRTIRPPYQDFLKALFLKEVQNQNGAR